jgi:hypothetical protein
MKRFADLSKEYLATPCGLRHSVQALPLRSICCDDGQIKTAANPHSRGYLRTDQTRSNP